ncbi:MAG: FAD:protein FMN transferase [Chitinophagaceae bacterium]|nr:FAD:protein FMN transferase [Chitinophagaceae bacterium]
MRLFIFILCFLICMDITAQVKCTRDAFLMGGRFEISLVAEDSLTAKKHIDLIIAEITRIENLISDWIPATQVSLINANAGIRPVKVDKELIDLTTRAIQIAELTNGAFDISFAAMEKIWKFDGSTMPMPARETVKKAREKVGYKNIIINKDSATIFLALKGMKIGFGALGEGYAADKCKEIMLAKGIVSGLINATGDIQAWGKEPDGQPWTIGINDPFEFGELIGILPIKGAITTSGSYEKYVIINGKRYAHIINPSTGYPVSGLVSVTVTGPSAEFANALSTSIMVLGKKKGLQLIKSFPTYSCLIIADNGKYHTSKNFNRKALESF